ncbi:MAG: FAD-binding oxidoreductase [Alphaproteobacteria bacterium]|nr:MAG: FAD-binding oxidoreductase [Alphaproteobacteria bacterium]
MPVSSPTNKGIIEDISNVIGAEHVLTGTADRILYSQDVYEKGETVAAIVRPGSTEELSRVVRLASQAGVAIVARGGGMSYTSGYLATEPDSLLLDMSRMNRVLEINAKDMYVTVECGITWKDLYEALKPHGLRTPYWGTLSGIRATVGGGLSQNSVFWGSGLYGTAADSVIGLEVVLADGRVVKTGSGARLGTPPFLRHFGPDLTGLFTADSGALGYKATATLRLISEPQVRRFASFDFKDFDSQIEAMCEISRKGLATECFGFDPFLQNQRALRESFAKDVKALGNVMKSAGSLLGALKDGVKVALAGRRFLANISHGVHVLIEDRSDAAADATLQSVRAIAKQFGGREIESSVPKILRANPFGPVNNMVGPYGERWVPVHGLTPHSRARDTIKAITSYIASHNEAIEKHNIGIGYLLATVSTTAMVVEPVFFWQDELNELHRASVEKSVQENFRNYPEDLEARSLVHTLRKGITDIFREKGAVHLQIGKTYDYIGTLDPASAELVRAVKKAVDPQGRVNPGALGLP